MVIPYYQQQQFTMNTEHKRNDWVMQRLKDVLNELKVEKVFYYSNDNLPFNCFKDVLENPQEFIQKYFQSGGKGNFLPAIPKGKNRAKHIVTTYFLGCYLNKRYNLFNCNGTGTFLNRDNNFYWAWYLCSLYHDIYSCRETKNTRNTRRVLDISNYGFCSFDDTFLYSKNVLYKYACKEANIETTHDEKGKVHFDHGILAGINLYNKYCELITNYVNKDLKEFSFAAGCSIPIGENKAISLEIFYVVCKISKMLACHNVFLQPSIDVGSSKEYQEEARTTIVKYEEAGLGQELKDKLRLIKNGAIGDYEKLYWLLCLVDNLECAKKEINLNNVLIRTDEQGIHLSLYKVSEKKKQRYYNSLKDMETWLDGIDDVTIGEDVVHINFAQGIVS